MLKKLMYFTLAAVMVVVDQLIKLWALATLPGRDSIVVIPGLLKLTYVENRGMAFGMLWGATDILLIVTGIVLCVIVYLLATDKFPSTFASICLTAILSGGIGNFIDRLFRGFVVDYLDISDLFSFAVFNLADSLLVVGAFALGAYVLFFEGKEKKS